MESGDRVIGVTAKLRDSEYVAREVRRRQSESAPNSGGKAMAKDNVLRDAAMRVGSAVGRVDAKAHKAARKAVKAAHVELVAITKQVDTLKRRLTQSTKRLKTALK